MKQFIFVFLLLLGACAASHHPSDLVDASVADASGETRRDTGVVAPFDAGRMQDAQGNLPSTHRFVQVALHRYTTCARDEVGDVFCWGAWFNRSNPPATPDDEIVRPTKVVGIKDAEDVTVFVGYACAAQPGGIACWGRTPFASEPSEWTQPIVLPESKNASKLASSKSRVCAVVGEDQHVRCWGSMFEHEPCGAPAPPASAEMFDLGGTAGARELRLNGGATCAILDGDRARCLVYEDSDPVVHEFTSGGLADLIVYHSTGCFSLGEQFCVVNGDGGVACEGRNIQAMDPIFRISDGASIERVVQRGETNCFTTEDNALWCNDGDEPVATGLVDVAASIDHACLINAEKRLLCWGSNEYGQLGVGTSARTSESTEVAGIANVVQIEAGRGHTCALHKDGSVSCWGANVNGERGFSVDTEALPIPAMRPETFSHVAATIELGVQAQRVFVDGLHSCVSHAEGMTCWGDSYRGYPARNGPTLIPGIPSDLRSAKVGDSDEACVVDAQGDVLCFGWGYYGTRTGVEKLSLPEPVREVSGDLQRSCALLESGNGYCWGSLVENSQRKGSVLTPQPEPAIQDARHAADGGSTILGTLSEYCFVDKNSDLVCPFHPYTPEDGEAIVRAHRVAEFDPPCLFRQDGSVGCFQDFGDRWRDGQAATLADPKIIEVPGMRDAIDIAAGDEHACALRAGGTVECWGWREAGRLGDGSRTTYPEPTGVVDPRTERE